MKDWTELEVMLRFQTLTVELLQRQIGGYSKILAEYQGNAWDVLVACNHDPVDSPVTSEGKARLVMKPTIHMPVRNHNTFRCVKNSNGCFSADDDLTRMPRSLPRDNGGMDSTLETLRSVAWRDNSQRAQKSCQSII